MANESPILKAAYWSRPAPQAQGDKDANLIYHAVGQALSQWERADQELAELFSTLIGCTDNSSYGAVKRAYGAIENSTLRRKAVEAAAEVYFSPYWESKAVKQSLTHITNAVGEASKRRDDIAHGVVWGDIKIDNCSFGAFHSPEDML